MKTKSKSSLWRKPAFFSLLFIVFTLLLRVVDVQAIGPLGSSVGFASVNGWFHELTGVNLFWYELTNKLGMLALASAGIFALIGFFQLIQRKSLQKVDASLYVLAVYYAVVLVVYVLFELLVVNCRPILMDGQLEASYPSSHTMLSVCFMMAAIAEFGLLVKSRGLCRLLQAICVAVMVIMVFGRLISGVHWFTDILGGLLISVSLVSAHRAALHCFTEN